MTTEEKYTLLVPAVRALTAAANKIVGHDPDILDLHLKAAWVGELLSDGAHGVERTSIVEALPQGLMGGLASKTATVQQILEDSSRNPDHK